MNIWIFLATAGFVLMEVWVSWEEEGLRSQFPIQKHGGIWGDFLLFSFINALAWKYLRIPSLQTLALILIVSVITSVLMHQLWFSTQGLSSWLWPKNPQGGCWKAMSVAGRMHFIFMAAQITILALFVLSPAPAPTIWLIAVLLTVFWPLGVLQPCWYITSRWLDPMAIGTSIILVSGTWGISLIKLFRPEWIASAFKL